ncbi:MAG: hypothetical protein AAF865_12430 [Pseudomonadota bacterium]
MVSDPATLELRARDFWAALSLIALSLFFLWKTSAIPLFGDQIGGVSGITWYDSAAIVPLGIFASLLVLAMLLLINAIRSGGAAQALSAVGIGWDHAEALRFASIAVCLTAYIGSLVPRVDFVIASGLLITCLIYGFQHARPGRMLLSSAAMLLSAAYALIANFARSEWGAHDDDLLGLAFWALMTLVVLWQSRWERLLRVVPVIALVAPLILVMAMAFGFRQNVPARTGLLFSQIEYHYYVTLRPLWSE